MVAPNGCPMAKDPPLILTLSSEIFSFSMQFKVTILKASLISQKSISFTDKFAYSRALIVAGTGPLPMTRESTPAQPIDTIRANGFRFLFSASSDSMRIAVVAPAFKGDEFPAVITPFNKNDELDNTEKEILTMAACKTTDSPINMLIETLKEINGSRIAVDAGVPGVSCIDADIVDGVSVFQEIRMVKTEKEIAQIKRSFEIVEKAIFKSLEIVKKGISEKELAAEFEKIVYENKGRPAFSVIGFGKRSAFPNVQPSQKRLEKGEVIRFDVGCVYNNYYSDMSRIAACGNPPQKYKDYYAAVVAGEKRALQEIKSGVPASRVFQAGVDTVKKGIPHFKRHHIGHGIGLKLYDPPSLGENEVLLEENMVLCVETPYYELGFAGVQIEDAVVVTKKGYELITQSGKDIEVIPCM